MKYTTLLALFATVSATKIATNIQTENLLNSHLDVQAHTDLDTASQAHLEALAQLETLEKSLTFLQVNPHLIATSYLKQAQKEINALVKKATANES